MNYILIIILIIILLTYYDFNKILVNNKPYKLYNSINNNDYSVMKKKYKNDLLMEDDLFKNINNNILIDIPYSQSIIDIAKKVANELSNNYMCIHVRRGDRITNKQIDIDTMPSNILKVIQKQNKIKNIYIMTNKIDEVKSLKNNKDYNIYFNTDFNFLYNIDDNYYLFSIENEIMRLANNRCSTFKTNNNYYDYYLTDEKGFQ